MDCKFVEAKNGQTYYYIKLTKADSWNRVDYSRYYDIQQEILAERREAAIAKPKREVKKAGARVEASHKLSPRAAAEMPGRIDEEIQEAYGTSQSPLVNAIRRGDPVPPAIPMPQSHFMSPDESDFVPSGALGHSLDTAKPIFTPLWEYSEKIPHLTQEMAQQSYAVAEASPFSAPMTQPSADPVNHPPHYTSHPSGVECIQITEHMNFCLGNAMKYLWRAGLKGGHEDLLKAIWYIKREINRTGGAI